MAGDGAPHGRGELCLIAKEKGIEGGNARKSIAVHRRGGGIEDVVLPPEEIPKKVAPVLVIALIGNRVTEVVG